MLESDKLVARGIFALQFALYGFSMCYNFAVIRIPNEGPVYHKLYYLTVLNVLFLIGFYGLNAFCGRSLKRRLDAVFAFMIFPLSVFVCSTFWGLFCINDELIMPKRIQPFFPVWYNHATHTLPLLTVLLDSIIVVRHFPPLAVSLRRVGCICVAYLSLVHVVAYLHNFEFWVYPVLKVLSFWPRIAFFIALFLVTSLFCYFGHVINLKRSALCHGKKRVVNKSR